MILLVACEAPPPDVLMYGTVQDAPRDEGTAVEGALVSIRGPDLAAWDESAPSDAEGAFEVNVPRGEDFYVEVTKDGYLPTAFSGSAGFDDFYTGDGYPWIASSAYVDTLRADFSSCPTADAEGGVVAGEVRMYFAVDDPNDMPIVATASIAVLGSDAEPLTTCYLDDEGFSSADATQTGATGRFAAFGLPEGPLIVEATWDNGQGTAPISVYSYYAADAAVVPMYPAIVLAEE